VPRLSDGRTAKQQRVLRIYYSPDYAGSAHAFDTTRKARWVADSLSESPIAGVSLVEPESLTEDRVAVVHAPDYIAAVRTGQPRDLAESQGFDWDPGLWPMVAASNGGVVAAALDALENGTAGSLSSGLHHARHDHGAGFCTFNGLVIAARAVLEAGATSVLILDLDAHCGGGTASLIADDPRIWHTDVSVSSYDRYASSSRAHLDLVQNAGDYLPTIQRRLADLNHSGIQFDLCIYNAGMDPFEGSGIGGMRGITREMLSDREQAVFAWCRERGLPVAFVLAGGYISSQLDEQALVGLHRLTVSHAAATVSPSQHSG
jgi:acetoin utilization deacetylase AcuC-like enzyme